MAKRMLSLSTPEQSNLIDLKTGQPAKITALPLICNRVRHYRLALGMEQKELAARLGIKATAVSNWENGRARPDINLLPELCDLLGCTLYDLFDMDDPTVKYSPREMQLVENFDQLKEVHKTVIEATMDSLIAAEDAEDSPDLRMLIHYEKGLAAGVGSPIEFDDIGKRVYVYETPETRRANWIFPVSGDSMEPRFHDGQEVLVQKPSFGFQLQPGEIGAFVADNETYIKVYQQDGLHSLNPKYDVMRFNEEEEQVLLIGKVVGVMDPDDYASKDDVKRYKLRTSK